MRAITLFLSATCLLLAGCNLTTKSINNGYLPNYDKLTVLEDSSLGYQMRWISNELTQNISPFKPKSIFLEPVQYYPRLESNEQFDQKHAKDISAYIDFRLKEVVEKYFPIATTKDKNTLVIKPAITAVKISLEDMSPLEVVPFRAVISAISLTTGARDRDVEIRLESKITKGNSDQLIGATVHGGQGLQLENSSEQLTQKHVKQLIDNWVFAWDQQLKAYKQKLDANS